MYSNKKKSTSASQLRFCSCTTKNSNTLTATSFCLSKGAQREIQSISVASIWLSTWRRLSRRLAANGANSAKGANNSTGADGAHSVNLGGGGKEGEARSHALKGRSGNINKAQRSFDSSTHRG